MKNLWSPWRSKYIESFKNDSKTEHCIFCDAAMADVEVKANLLVRKSKLTFSILNLYPYNNGHLMIVPFRHVKDFTDLTAEENSEIMYELQLSQKALVKVVHPAGFNIGANLGKPAGAGIDDHIHFHIVPRWNGDTNFMPVLGEVKVISQELLSTKQRLIEAYKEILSEKSGG